MPDSEWRDEAASRVREAIDGRGRRRWFHQRAVIATMRTSYRPIPLPAGFETRVVETAGASRRLAVARGRGRPVMILPGMHARLDEGLFVEIARIFRERLGRPVALVEDRFAPETIRMNGGALPTLRSLGEETAGLAATLGERPDAMALSAGAAGALAAPAGTFARAALWSAAIDPEAVMGALARHPLIAAYFGRLHRRSFREGGALTSPGQAVLARRLGSDRPLPPRDLSILAVHAKDDPVAPYSSLLSLRHLPGLKLALVSAGGHLGFGGVAGIGVYLLPFEGDQSR